MLVGGDCHVGPRCSVVGAGVQQGCQCGLFGCMLCSFTSGEFDNDGQLPCLNVISCGKKKCMF